MGNEGSPGILPAGKLDELIKLLKAGLYEDFMKMFKTIAKETDFGDAVTLTELVNKRLGEDDPECDMKLVISQQTAENKHLIMIMDNSRLFGDSWTITRNMFTV